MKHGDAFRLGEEAFARNIQSPSEDVEFMTQAEKGFRPGCDIRPLVSSWWHGWTNQYMQLGYHV